MPDSAIRSLTTEYGFVLQDVWNAELAKWTVRRSRGSGEAQSVLANGSKGCRGDDASCDNDTFSERKPIKRRWCKSNVSYGPGNYLQDFLFMNVCQQMLICGDTMRRPVFVGRYYCGCLLKKRSEVEVVEEKRLIEYSMQLAMLKQLLIKKLITDDEYDRIKARIMKQYGIVSNIPT